MNSKFYFILSAIFIIASGFIYTIERLSFYINIYLWKGKEMMEVTIPKINIYFYLLILISSILFLIGIKKTIKLKK